MSREINANLLQSSLSFPKIRKKRKMILKKRTISGIFSEKKILGHFVSVLVFCG